MQPPPQYLPPENRWPNRKGQAGGLPITVCVCVCGGHEALPQACGCQSNVGLTSQVQEEESPAGPSVLGFPEAASACLLLSLSPGRAPATPTPGWASTHLLPGRPSGPGLRPSTSHPFSRPGARPPPSSCQVKAWPAGKCSFWPS